MTTPNRLTDACVIQHCVMLPEQEVFGAAQTGAQHTAGSSEGVGGQSAQYEPDGLHL